MAKQSNSQHTGWPVSIVAATCITLLTSCASTPALTEHPAFIVDADDNSRTDLLSAVRAALNNAPITLADDALTRDSVLLVERTPRFDPNGLPIYGRRFGKPERFELSTDGERCILTHLNTERRQVLKHVQCKASTQAFNSP